MATRKRPASRKYSSKPTHLTFATLDTKRGYRLGLKTERGILDVERASGIFRIKAPIKIDEVLAGADCAPLKKQYPAPAFSTSVRFLVHTVRLTACRT